MYGLQWTQSAENGHELARRVKSKITGHKSAPFGTFALPTKRFEHVHFDIVILPISEGYRYCLTCIDRFMRWPEAIPMENQKAESRPSFLRWMDCSFRSTASHYHRPGTSIWVTAEQIDGQPTLTYHSLSSASKWSCREVPPIIESSTTMSW